MALHTYLMRCSSGHGLLCVVIMVMFCEVVLWLHSVQLSSVTQSCLTLCNPMDCSTQASLSITNSRSSLRLMSIESGMPSSHLILGRPLLLLLPVPPSIRVFSNESTLHMRWPKYWSFSFRLKSVLPMTIQG